MSWLVAHDVWPSVTADDPPSVKSTEWIRGEGRESQFTIHDGSRKLGTIWSTYLLNTPRSGGRGSSSQGEAFPVQREDIIWLDHLPSVAMQMGYDITPLRVISDSTFSTDGQLDEFTLRVASNHTNLRLHGERFHADFSFVLEGPALPRRVFKLPLSQGGLIADLLNPLTQLPGLRVGQRWRMQVFNPLTAVTGLGERFIPMLVNVTGEERIATPGGEATCFVVESSAAGSAVVNTTAWVDANGVVLMQEVKLPGLGTIRIVREAQVDKAARMKARRARLH